MEHEMFFLNPVFHPGINITVRNGDKWMKVDIQDSLALKKNGENVKIANGTVIGKALIPFGLIPATWLAYEHDPFCCNRIGLFKTMERAYADFTETNFVTVIIFTV